MSGWSRCSSTTIRTGCATWWRVGREERAARVAERRRATPEVTWETTQEQLDGWRAALQEPDADELAGVYTAPAPVTGGWRVWIEERWPTALG